jgi:hypothetical protein
VIVINGCGAGIGWENAVILSATGHAGIDGRAAASHCCGLRLSLNGSDAQKICRCFCFRLWHANGD